MNFNFRRAVLLLALFVALAGLHLYITTQNIGLKYRLTDQKVKYNKLKDHNRQLALQIARQEDLGKIEQAAREKLMMVYPEKVRYILLSPEAAP